jgi:hypothetical protein
MRIADCRIMAMRIPSRRTFWLTAALLLAVFGVCLFIPPRRITYAKFWQIKQGMSPEEVKAILGNQFQVLFKSDMSLEEVKAMLGNHFLQVLHIKDEDLILNQLVLQWSDGPDWIYIEFRNDKTVQRQIHVADRWETVKWHAKRIGITW